MTRRGPRRSSGRAPSGRPLGRGHPWQKIIAGVFAACADPAGVTALRRGALERVALLLADWRDTRARLADTEQRMTAVPGELELTGLVTSITGLSAVGAASDPGRDR